jgi:hypothetical protein
MDTVNGTKDPFFFPRKVFETMLDVCDQPFYSFTMSLKPLLSTLLALTYALYILAYPPKYRKLGILLLVIPTVYAFLNYEHLAPSSAVCDTFGRFLYIWLAHMSYIVTIKEWSPPVIKENDGWRSRVRAAYKVLFDRNDNSHTHGHNYSRRAFLLHHTWKAFYMYVLQNAWIVFTRYCVPFILASGAEQASFFRRLPISLDAKGLWAHFDHVIFWCVINKFLYDGYHSVFAVFFVGTGLDSHEEWSLSLFGPYAEAWSVRRYWGKHWHNYIYISFSEHSKIVTRKWLRMQRGTPLTRIVENTMVFGLSGLSHTLVRYVQDPDSGDHWPICFWYLGQMLPIVIEDVVQTLWRQKKKELGIRNTKWLDWAERCVGYTWVIAFNAWSIAKYLHLRRTWESHAMRIKYASEFAEWEELHPEWEAKTHEL